MKLFLLLATSLSLLFYSCNCKKVSSSEKVTSQEVESEEKVMREKPSSNSKDFNNPITNKYWKVVEIMGESVEMPEGMSQEPYLKLTSKGEIKGHGGCNSFFGKYELNEKNFIQFGEMAMTEMECFFKSYDSKLTEVLRMAQQYIMIGEDKMQLIVGKRAPLAKFEAVYFE